MAAFSSHARSHQRACSTPRCTKSGSKEHRRGHDPDRLRQPREDPGSLGIAWVEDQHRLRRAGQPDAAPPGQPVAVQDVMLLQEARVPGVSSAPGIDLLPLHQIPRQLVGKTAGASPDTGQRLTQEVATAHTRYSF